MNGKTSSASAPLAALHDSYVHIQMRLLPLMEGEFGELDNDHRQFVALCQQIEPLFPHVDFVWCRNGRPPVPRLWILRAFLAKALWNFPTTRALIEELGARPKMRRLCGFDMPGDVPGESTFSRAFRTFAENRTAQQIFERFTGRTFDGVPVHHESIDATAIHSWEKAAAEKPEKPEESRLDTQPDRTADENEAELPKVCDWGTKRNSKGVRETWRGYKLHVAVSDGDEHGGRTVRVRGHAKVALHLAFGVLVIAVEQVFRLLE